MFRPGGIRKGVRSNGRGGRERSLSAADWNSAIRIGLFYRVVLDHTRETFSVILSPPPAGADEVTQRAYQEAEQAVNRSLDYGHGLAIS